MSARDRPDSLAFTAWNRQVAAGVQGVLGLSLGLGHLKVSAWLGARGQSRVGGVVGCRRIRHMTCCVPPCLSTSVVRPETRTF